MQMIDTSQPIYASSALLFIGTADVYMFFSTGSDLLQQRAGRDRHVQAVRAQGQRAGSRSDDQVRQETWRPSAIQPRPVSPPASGRRPRRRSPETSSFTRRQPRARRHRAPISLPSCMGLPMREGRRTMGTTTGRSTTTRARWPRRWRAVRRRRSSWTSTCTLEGPGRRGPIFKCSEIPTISTTASARWE